MDSKERNINLYLLALTPFALAVIVWALMAMTPAKIDSGVVTLAALTVFCSCYLRIQLPRVNIHLTITDGLIIFAMLQYGGEIAVLLSAVEIAAASLNMLRGSMPIKVKTIFINVGMQALTVFAAYYAVSTIFGPIDLILQRNQMASFVWIIASMAMALFLVNSLLVAVYTALKKEMSFWSVWSGNLASAIVLYLTGGVVGGIMVKALEKVDFYLLAGVIVFFGIVYLTFRRFVDDVKKTVEKAKAAERERAEQAEEHVHELQHYVAELERSSEALQESHENFRHAAYHDALTGLPNRNYFIDTLKELLHASRENTESNFAVLFLDLKSFKTINDSLGHSLGDRLIKNVAKRLEGLVREDDMVGRFGGDKFGIILADLLSREEATAFADRLAKRLAEPYTLDGRQVFTSAKIGIAYGNSKYPEAEDILRDADIAMYYAKDNEENYVIFDQKMHIRAVTRLQLETDLRFAIERNEFELYYQPIISLDTATLEGFEALVRWNHPQRGLVPPNEFIPISESTGLIIPKTVQILNSAFSKVRKRQLK